MPSEVSRERAPSSMEYRTWLWMSTKFSVYLNGRGCTPIHADKTALILWTIARASYDPARFRACHFAFVDYGYAVDDHFLDSHGELMRFFVGGLVGDGDWVEQDQVGIEAFLY